MITGCNEICLLKLTNRWCRRTALPCIARQSSGGLREERRQTKLRIHLVYQSLSFLHISVVKLSQSSSTKAGESLWLGEAVVRHYYDICLQSSALVSTFQLLNDTRSKVNLSPANWSWRNYHQLSSFRNLRKSGSLVDTDCLSSPAEWDLDLNKDWRPPWH